MESIENDDVSSNGRPAGAWTVSQLNDEIDRTLTNASDRVAQYIVGEVAEIDQYDFGTSFESRDVEQDPLISCLAWATEINDFDHDLEAGTEAVVEATVDFYPKRGDCQLLVSDYWPLGMSNRQDEFEQLSHQLASEGLFDNEQKQQLPKFPSCIGVITSPSGSTIEDFCTTVSERSPRTTMKLSGATARGEDAVSEVVAGIQSLDADPSVESIVITRGAGRTRLCGHSIPNRWCGRSRPVRPRQSSLSVTRTMRCSPNASPMLVR